MNVCFNYIPVIVNLTGSNISIFMSRRCSSFIPAWCGAPQLSITGRHFSPPIGLSLAFGIQRVSVTLQVVNKVWFMRPEAVTTHCCFNSRRCKWWQLIQRDFLGEHGEGVARGACAVNYHLSRSEVKRKQHPAIALKYYKALMILFQHISRFISLSKNSNQSKYI